MDATIKEQRERYGEALDLRIQGPPKKDRKWSDSGPTLEVQLIDEADGVERVYAKRAESQQPRWPQGVFCEEFLG